MVCPRRPTTTPKTASKWPPVTMSPLLMRQRFTGRAMKVYRVRNMSVDYGPRIGRTPANLFEIGHFWLDSATCRNRSNQIRSTSGRSRPNLDEIGPKLAEFGQGWSNSVPNWSNAAEVD